MTEKIPERKEIPDQHKWDLTPLFASDEQWETLFVEIESELPRYNDYQGRLAGSVDAFKKAVVFDLDISRKLDRLFTYAHLKSDENKANQNYLGFHQRAMGLGTKASELSSYMTPEIQSIPDGVMAAYRKDPGLQEYGHYLDKILRYKPHTLSVEMERMIAMSGEMSRAPSDIFSQLDNADLTFGSITDDTGKEMELSHANFSTFLINRDRDVRKKAFFQYYRSYDAHKNSIAAALHYSNKKDCFYSRVRNFENCRRASLFSDNVSDEVYDNLIATVRNNFGPLFRYLDFRKRALGLPDLHFYDTYVPITGDVRFYMPYDEAVETCITALSALGKEYTAELGKGLRGGWVDRYENRGKRSGAYSSGCYDSPPYILMNYRDDNINSLYTLIHEAGHSMHSWYANRKQPYLYHDYTIFVAEVASTFNESLLSRHLLDLFAGDQKMQSYILNREIDNIRATLYRQCMFAEFEKLSHREAEENRPLTLEVMRGIYRGLLKTYFGESLVIDEELTLECLRIPHFYSPFYVYKYATGISAAMALSQYVAEGGSAARDAYIGFLSLGGSAYPLDELRAAGVDMSKPEPIEKAISHFGSLVDRLIALHNGL